MEDESEIAAFKDYAPSESEAPPPDTTPTPVCIDDIVFFIIINVNR